MKLTWSAFALSDRDAIFTYIEADHPAAAVLIDDEDRRGYPSSTRFSCQWARGQNCRDTGTRHQWHALHRGLYHYGDDSSNTSCASWRARMARTYAAKIIGSLARSRWFDFYQDRHRGDRILKRLHFDWPSAR